MTIIEMNEIIVMVHMTKTIGMIGFIVPENIVMVGVIEMICMEMIVMVEMIGMIGTTAMVNMTEILGIT